MQGLKQIVGVILVHPTTNVPVGVLGADGKEYLFLTQANTAALTTPSLSLSTTDGSGAPGNVTINTPRGRAAIATGVASITVTNPLVTANSTILVALSSTDVTLTSLLRVVPGAGSFTVTGVAVATAPAVFDFVVLN